MPINLPYCQSFHQRALRRTRSGYHLAWRRSAHRWRYHASDTYRSRSITLTRSTVHPRHNIISACSDHAPVPSFDCIAPLPPNEFPVPALFVSSAAISMDTSQTCLRPPSIISSTTSRRCRCVPGFDICQPHCVGDGGGRPPIRRVAYIKRLVGI